jgi:hypothetical protein
MNDANVVLAQMVEEGVITAEERARMVVGGYARRKDELLAPFVKEGQFQQLMVDDLDISSLPDTAWDEYQRDGDKEALARKKALIFRAVFMCLHSLLLSPLSRAQRTRAARPVR